MSIIIILLILVVIYLLVIFKNLEKRVDSSNMSILAEKILIRNFIRKSNALKEDVEKYNKDAFFDGHWKDAVVFGENEDALLDKREFLASLQKEEFDFTPNPILPAEKKAEELLKNRIIGIINNIQTSNPKVIHEPYADWFKNKSGFRTMMISLRWMLPEIEAKLTEDKISITGDFVKLKNAMISDDLVNLMPSLFDEAKRLTAK